ncbi:Ubl carboxyl-terminal hydrolase 18 [Channa argus]|uniref:Ubiquitin carboxyl-terminal hydrolase n=1 Tax=Channa argus TaxID=215402 RepID=A0A6G1Q636_CHAAH|nr:Ubl carboxyl-terminal hydrolase 18 [Channa argus]
MNLLHYGREMYTSLCSPGNIKYHGLFNQGATCYLNSVLQVLFMTKDFREALERNPCNNPDNVDHHLKTLFDQLKSCTARTYDITNKLNIDTVNEQRDAAEYFEKILTQTSPEASKIFHVQLTHKTICSQCKIEKTNDAPMWHLPLSLMDSYSQQYSVVDGIEDYFRDSHFSGLDQMYCDQCDEKVDVTIKCEVKHHPEVLVLLLKRFEFHYSYMRYVKNNRFVDVPHTIQIPKNQTYELYAVVDHYGDLRGGHYAATIQSQDDNDEQWYNFNDTTVTLLTYQLFQVDSIHKSQTAHLLFYRKQKTTDTWSQNIRNESTCEGLLPATSGNYDQSQDTEEILKSQESEEKAEAVYDTEETSDPCHNVKDQNNGVNVRQSEKQNPQESNEGMNDLHAHQHTHEKEIDEGKIIRYDKEMEGNEINEQSLERETFPEITQIEENVEGQHNVNTGLYNNRQRRMDIVHDFEQENSNRLQNIDPLNKTDELSDAPRRLIDVNKVRYGHTVGDEQPLTENLNRDPKKQGSEGLDDNRKSTNKDPDGKLKAHGNHEQQRDTGDVREENGHEPGRGKSTLKVHCHEGVENQHDRNNTLECVGEEQREKEDVIIYKIKKVNKHCLHNIQDHKVEISDLDSGKCLDGYREEKEGGKRNDEQRRRTSERYCGEDVKGPDDVRKDRTHEQMQQDVNIIRCKDLGSKKHNKQEKKEDNEHILGREGVREGRECVGNWEEAIEHVRKPEETQPDAQSTLGEGIKSKAHLKHQCKRKTETVEETSHGNKKKRSQISSSASDRSTDTLVKGVSTLKIKSNPKNKRIKGNIDKAEENESIIHLNDGDIYVREQADKTTHPSDKRGDKERKGQQFKDRFKLSRKRKNSKVKTKATKEKTKTPGCFCFFKREEKEKKENNNCILTE